jgi:hypothetical protein
LSTGLLVVFTAGIAVTLVLIVLAPRIAANGDPVAVTDRSGIA